MSITLYPNILSKEQCSLLLQKYDIKNYHGNDMVYFSTPSTGQEYNIKKLKIKDDIVEKICQRLNINHSDVDSCHLVYYPNNSFNSLHADNCIIKDNTITRVKTWTRSVIIFLNEDFEGGELVYPYYGISITPTIGTCVISPADENYLHLVNQVIGERYALVLRITDK